MLHGRKHSLLDQNIPLPHPPHPIPTSMPIPWTHRANLPQGSHSSIPVLGKPLPSPPLPGLSFACPIKGHFPQTSPVASSIDSHLKQVSWLPSRVPPSHIFLYNAAALTGVFIPSLDSYLPRAEIMGGCPPTQPQGPALYLHRIHTQEM